MRMKNPSHPGLGLRDDLDALGVSVAEAADNLGVTRQQLYNVLNGKSGISPEMALRLEKGLGGTAKGWLDLQTAYDLSQARLKLGTLKIKRMQMAAHSAN